MTNAGVLWCTGSGQSVVIERFVPSRCCGLLVLFIHIIDDLKLGILERCAEDNVEEIRSLGAVPLLLSLLSPKTTDDRGRSTPDVLMVFDCCFCEFADVCQPLPNKDSFHVAAACCATLTKLSLVDSIALDVREGNGIFLISSFLLFTATSPEGRVIIENLQVLFFVSQSAVDVAGQCVSSSKISV